jgi:peptidoglycan-associated lipoprotein
MMSKVRIVSAALLVGVLAACHSGTKLTEPGKGTVGEQPNPNAVAQVNVDELNNPNSPLAKRSVYFDFDSYSVKDEYLTTLQAHARYLDSHRNTHILIQGNTDERGTSEYNLALGQKRAEAVRGVLKQYGVSDSQMESVSLGKEKPKANGHDESSWAENRRGDIVYQ